ncbi:MAG: hypothetical protein RLZZ490_2257 [Cyanobacteriota bacterium]
MNKFNPSSRPWWIQHLDKGLFAGGMFYLLLVGVWISLQSRQPPETEIAEAESIEIVTQDDQQFIAYLRQSLETLKQPSASSQTAPQAPLPLPEPTVAITNIPPPPQLPNPSQGVIPAPIDAPPSTTVVERYYYPVYPNNTIAPSTGAQPALPPTVQAPPPVPMVASVTKHDLVGVLESGDRSSALFRWNDMTQKIQLGETIGSSGWQLTSVVGQKAILSRQGKTRYLEVGQSF